MFLNTIKDFFIKKKVKKTLSILKHTQSDNFIKTVGIVFDESYFYEKESLLKELISKGIKQTDIRILVFKDKIKKNETFDYATFTHKDISWTGIFHKQEINDFVNEKIDLLISYYDIEKAALLLITQQSKASFKVGFAQVDKRLNHFMIDTNAENFTVFIDELFKYLKILKKI